MTVGLQTFAEMYSRYLESAAHLLGKAEEHAKAKGISESEILEWRLADDMFPLRLQFNRVIHQTAEWMARAAGQSEPTPGEEEKTFGELKASVAASQAYLAGLSPEQFKGRDDVNLPVKLGGNEISFPVGHWVTSMATSNILFHLATAYGILRSKGVPIGKMDFFANKL